MASSTSERTPAAWRHAAARAPVALALVALAAAGASAQPAPPAPAGPGAAAGPLDDGAAEPVATLPDGTRRVRGRVVEPHADHVEGVPGVWVTLHRVGRDTAGPIDSVRTGGGGRYAFTYRPRGEAGAVYFVAASRGGVAYFGSPLRLAVVEGEPAELTVFDTTSRPVALKTSGRHLIVARPGAGGAREVLEVFELSNDTSVTVVPPAASARGVWSTALPAGAAGFAVRESSDVPADGMIASGGRATLLVPVAPGVKQVAFSYRLPASAFPLRVDVAPGTGVLEVLLEDPRGRASGGGLAPAGPVALEGKTFQRFIAQNAGAGGAVDVQVEAAQGEAWPRWAVPALLAVVGGGMAAALVFAGRRRRAGRRPAPPVVPAAARGAAPAATLAVPRSEQRDRLLAELAALDDAFTARGTPSSAERADYERRRAEIKARLAAELDGAALAAAGGRG